MSSMSVRARRERRCAISAISRNARTRFAGEAAAWLFDEYLNRFFSDGNAFATCEGGIGLIDHRDEFEPPPLTLFPKRKCLLNGFFLALEAAVLDGFANERLLIRS